MNNQFYHGNMVITSEIVTPQIAKRWLEQNTGNRRLRKQLVSQYSRDMTQDRWELIPVAVCFDEQGKVGNGQHTLEAIVESGEPQRLLVARNVTRAQIAAMDVGLKRSLQDLSMFLEKDLSSLKGSIARIIKYRFDTNKRSFQEIFEAYDEHRDVIDFVADHARGKITGLNSAVLSVCARAAYTEDRERIARFLEIIKTGVVDDPATDMSAIRLRDFVRGLRGGFNAKLKQETYQKTQSALRHFLDRRPVTKIYGTSEEMFPTPYESN